jgi:hypothetical protein
MDGTHQFTPALYVGQQIFDRKQWAVEGWQGGTPTEQKTSDRQNTSHGKDTDSKGHQAGRDARKTGCLKNAEASG